MLEIGKVMQLHLEPPLCNDTLFKPKLCYSTTFHCKLELRSCECHSIIYIHTGMHGKFLFLKESTASAESQAQGLIAQQK